MDMNKSGMKHVSIYLTVSLVVVAMIIGMVVGYYISPTYQMTMFTDSEMGLGKADRFVDLRYINKMIAHHRGAIFLADQVIEKSNRKEIKLLAEEIRTNEPKLIKELYDWKKEWYLDTKVVSDPTVINIGEKDDKTDLRFLNALITHHVDGIEMTKEIKTKSSRNEILDNAEAVETFLSTSILTLKTWRESWYKIN